MNLKKLLLIGALLTPLSAGAAVTSPKLPQIVQCYGSQGFNLNTGAPPVDLGTIAIVLPATPTPNWRVNNIIVSNETTSLTTATIQIWTAAGGTGTQLTSGTQALTGATGGDAVALPTPNNNTLMHTTTVTVREIAAQGGAATAQIYICINNLPTQ